MRNRPAPILAALVVHRRLAATSALATLVTAWVACGGSVVVDGTGQGGQGGQGASSSTSTTTGTTSGTVTTTTVTTTSTTVTTTTTVTSSSSSGGPCYSCASYIQQCLQSGNPPPDCDGPNGPNFCSGSADIFNGLVKCICATCAMDCQQSCTGQGQDFDCGDCQQQAISNGPCEGDLQACLNDG